MAAGCRAVLASAASQKLGQRAGRRGRGLHGGGVHGARDADPARAQPPGHVLLCGGRPGVVVLAVDDQHRQLAELGQLGGPVRRGEHVTCHQDEAVRIVAEHPPGQERDDRSRHSGRDRLRLQVRPPELGDAVPERGFVRQLSVPDAEGGEHRPQLPGPRAAEGGRSGAHQREGREPGVGQDGLAGHQPAVGVPDQVPGPGDLEDSGDIGRQLGHEVAVRVTRGRRLELPAHVDRHHLATTVGQQVQDRQEVFLASGVAGDEQGAVPLAHPRRRSRLERGERAAAGMNRGTPYPTRQLQGRWCAHSGETYPARLDKT